MSSRVLVVYENQIPQNGLKTIMKMVCTGKNWAKLDRKYTKFCSFGKTHNIVSENKQESQARLVTYLLCNCYTFLSGSYNRMVKGR